MIAEAAGFHLVDLRIEFCRRIDAQAVTETLPVRHFRESDLPELKKIAADAYLNSRFYYDRNFTRERASALYQEWIDKSCRGHADAVLVAEHEGGVGGFITCQLESPGSSPIGRIGLLGVSSHARGSGLGKALVNSALGYFEQKNAVEARVVTQGRNIAAQKLYQANGFKTHSLNLWYHKWLTTNALSR